MNHFALQAATLGICKGDILLGVQEHRMSAFDDLSGLEAMLNKTRPILLRFAPSTSPTPDRQTSKSVLSNNAGGSTPNSKESCNVM